MPIAVHDYTGSVGAFITAITFSDGTTYSLWRYRSNSQRARIDSTGNRLESELNSGEVTYVVDDAPADANQDVTVVFQQEALSSGGGGILLRAQPGSDVAYWYTLGQGAWAIYEQNGGTFNTPASGTYTETTSPVEARARAIDSTLIFDIAGTEVARVTDTNISSAGQVGIYMASGTGSLGMRLVSIDAKNVYVGTLDWTLPVPVFALEGDVSAGSPDVSGDMAMTVPQLVLSSTGLVLGPTEYTDTSIDSRFETAVSGLTRSVMSPEKDAGNPQWPGIGEIGTWDQDLYYPHKIWQVGNQWHMLCSAGNATGGVICYYTSSDGITWTRPNLGLWDYGGNSNNNIVIPDPAVETSDLPTYDGTEANRAHVLALVRVPGMANNGISVLTSPDALNWSEAKRIYEYPASGGTITDYQESKGQVIERSDGTWITYYSKGHFADPEIRQIGGYLSDTDDLRGDWTDLGILVTGTDADDQRYDWQVMPIDKYTWFAVDCKFNQTTDLLGPMMLYVSHDEGKSWTQVDSDWVPLGSSGAWDDAEFGPGYDLIRVGNTWRYYYTGTGEIHGAPFPLVELLGFVNIGYGRIAELAGTGTKTARAALAPRRYLLTADGTGGTITAELLNPATGVALSGYATTDFDTITTNVTEQPMTWGGQAPPAGTAVQLKLHLSDAEAYQYTATNEVLGPLALTLPVPVFSMAGMAVSLIEGDSAWTLPQLAFALTGSVVTPGAVTGDIAFSLPVPAFALVGSAVSEIVGDLAATLPVPVFALTGGVPSTITGTLAWTLPQFSMAMAGIADTLLDTCTITAQLHTLGGENIAGVTALLIIEQTPQSVDDSYIIAGMVTAVSDESGLITFPPVLRGARVLIRINDIGYLREVIVPNAETLQL